MLLSRAEPSAIHVPCLPPSLLLHLRFLQRCAGSLLDISLRLSQAKTARPYKVGQSLRHRSAKLVVSSLSETSKRMARNGYMHMHGASSDGCIFQRLLSPSLTGQGRM